ncbi:MAG TPA: hypothetical protein VEG65_03550 [Candidatus Bathyarchaeia archaeon]|nr:hypothetical protein [Candidatus Bathyarchaeia archaeon]
MKKQVGLIAFTALIVASVALTGVASAQASSVQVLFFYSPVARAAINGTGPVNDTNVTGPVNDTNVTGRANDTNVTGRANGADASEAKGTDATTAVIAPLIAERPSEAIVITTVKPLSAQSTTRITYAASGAPELKADPINCSPTSSGLNSLSFASQKCLVCTPACLVPAWSSNPLAAASAIASEASALSSVPNMTLPGAQTNSVASLPVQSVFEFSLLGLGAPMLLAGALYLMLRRV